MGLADILRRTFIGTWRPSTESVQRQILNLVNGHGSVESDSLYALINVQDDGDGQRHLVDQAAQILVNRGQVKAYRTDRKTPVDPVRAEGPYRLTLRLELEGTPQ